MKRSYKAIISAAMLTVALGASANENGQGFIEGPYTGGANLSAPVVSLPEPPAITEDTLKQLDRSPENLGRMMAFYVGSIPAIVEMCDWSEAEAESITAKTTRVMELYYGAMPLEMQIPFAQGYFNMEERMVEALNTSQESEILAICQRMKRDQKDMHKTLDTFLEPLEQAAQRGDIKPMSPYEGRTFELPSTSQLLENLTDEE